MSTIAIPTPGGAKVGLSKFAVIALGAAGGVAFVQAQGIKMLPEMAWNWSLGPISGLHVWFGVGALLGGAAGAMVSAKL